jgi:hypothetical protein
LLRKFKAHELRRARHSVQNAAKPRTSLLGHAYGHEVTSLKTYRGPKRKEQLGVCSLPGFYAPGVVNRLTCDAGTKTKLNHFYWAAAPIAPRSDEDYSLKRSGNIVMKMETSPLPDPYLIRVNDCSSGQRGVAGVAAGCWVVAGAAAGRARGSQRPFTMRIFRALHLRTAARTAEFRTQMPSTSWRPSPHPWRTGMTELFGC